MPSIVQYSSARRISCAFQTGLPSSLTPTQPARAEVGQLGQRFAFQTFADRADRIDAAGAVPPRLGDDHLRHRPLVVRRQRVGHRADGRVAAGHRRARAGGDRLFVFLARLAKMGVQIDQPGNDDEAFGVDGLDVRP